MIRRRNPDPLAERIAKTRATLAKARTGELDPFGVGTVDQEWVEFLSDKLASMEREAAGDAHEMRDLAREGAAQDAARALHSRHAMNHAEALARFIRDAGVNTARAWQAPGESRDARVYLPGGAGYLSVSADGSVNETERGRQVFAPSSLYRNMREAVKVGRQAYRDSFRERMERHDAERVAAVAKVRGNPRGPVRKRPLKTIPFNPRATRRRNPSAIPIASGLIVNPLIPTNDYRSGATRESAPLHIWWHNVLDLAGVTHAQSIPHRAQVNRWYQAGEPAWMAADGLRLLLLANARR